MHFNHVLLQIYTKIFQTETLQIIADLIVS